MIRSLWWNEYHRIHYTVVIRWNSRTGLRTWTGTVYQAVQIIGTYLFVFQFIPGSSDQSADTPEQAHIQTLTAGPKPNLGRSDQGCDLSGHTQTVYVVDYGCLLKKQKNKKQL